MPLSGRPEKLTAFLEKHPRHAKLVEGVAFKKKEASSKNTCLRAVLALSFHGMSASEKKALIEDYREVISGYYASFYLWERTTHLLVQNDGRFFDFGFWVIPIFGYDIKTKFYRFRERTIKIPTSRRLEPVIALSPVEKINLGFYLQNLARKGYKKMLGKYYDPGCQISNARLDDNRANPGHNCTSWITTAPLGEKGECLIELLGTERSHQIGTNPGWWTNWLLYAAPAERVPFVIYWSPDPIQQVLAEQVVSGKTIPWDFNKL